MTLFCRSVLLSLVLRTLVWGYCVTFTWATFASSYSNNLAGQSSARPLLVFSRPDCTIVTAAALPRTRLYASKSISDRNNKSNANWLTNWLLGRRAEDQGRVSEKRRHQLVVALLKHCNRSNNKKPDRSTTESLIDELVALSSPIMATATSSQLQKKWKLAYTTEKEINFFLDTGIAEVIYQTIDGSRLQNEIPFVNGGYFCVEGRLEVPDDHGVRTNFEFSTAVLNLGRWGEYRLPPVGKGWFDTIYLDDSLRIDRNSRQDILICLLEEKENLFQIQ